MDNFYLFLGVGAFLIYLILQFDKEQRRRLKRISKLSRNVEPLLLQQSVGKKLSVLQSALARFETATSIATHEQMPYVTISKQLKDALTAYSNGKLPISTYHQKLEDLINTIKKYDKELLSEAA